MCLCVRVRRGCCNEMLPVLLCDWIKENIFFLIFQHFHSKHKVNFVK